jgi:hypothetical protein
MNVTQRRVVLGAWLLGLLSFLFVPFRYSGHTGLVEPRPASGIVYRPIFSSPEHEVLYRVSGLVVVTRAEVDIGRLAAIWFAIAAITIAAATLARAGRPIERC